MNVQRIQEYIFTPNTTLIGGPRCLYDTPRQKEESISIDPLLRHVRQGGSDRTEAIHYKIHNNTLHSPTHNEQHGE